MLKKRIGLICGGKSGEHEVSIRSAQSIHAALDKSKYEVILIGIDKKGIWHLDNSIAPLIQGSSSDQSQVNETAPAIVPISDSAQVVMKNSNSMEPHKPIDVFFPIAHGTYGEDGCLQGMLRLLDAPFVGAGVLGSAVGMDKVIMKRLLREAGIPIGKFLSYRDNERERILFETVVSDLGIPFFVKPANMGSSVGISKVADENDFAPAIREAFLFDRKIILEQFIEGREIECSVLGNENPEASVPGEILVNADFYSYEAKYVDENGAALEIPAKLDAETAARIRKMAVDAFQALECAGMARVDFFLREDGAVFINEINTLPGFTRISMYPKLWEASGLPYPALLDRLIDLAIENHAKDRALKRSFTP